MCNVQNKMCNINIKQLRISKETLFEDVQERGKSLEERLRHVMDHEVLVNQTIDRNTHSQPREARDLIFKIGVVCAMLGVKILCAAHNCVDVFCPVCGGWVRLWVLCTCICPVNPAMRLATVPHTTTQTMQISDAHPSTKVRRWKPQTIQHVCAHVRGKKVEMPSNRFIFNGL